MELNTALWYTGGLMAFLVLLQVMAKPLEWAFRIVGNSIAGGVALLLVNAAGNFVGFHIGLNPFTAVTVGMLGIPGLIALVVVRTILG